MFFSILLPVCIAHVSSIEDVKTEKKNDEAAPNSSVFQMRVRHCIGVMSPFLAQIRLLL